MSMNRPSNARIRLARSVHALRRLSRNLHALSLAALVIVVFALAVLQHRWIDEVSKAQEKEAKSRLREEVRLIVDAME
jgi:predicted exporter